MEIIPILLIVLICAALLLGYPVAFTLAGTSILFALLGIALDFFDPNLSMLISSGPKYLETKCMDSIGTKTLLLFLYSISKHSLLVFLVLIFFKPLKIPIPLNK